MKKIILMLVLSLVLVSSVNAFGVGSAVEVLPNEGLNMRGPEACSGALTIKTKGSQGYIISGAAFCDDHYRWKIRWSDGSEGWSAQGNTNELWLKDLNIQSSTKFSVNDKVRATDALNVRSNPTELGWISSVSGATEGTVLEGPVYAVPKGTSGFYNFWKVNFGSVTGWAAENWLSKVNVESNNGDGSSGTGSSSGTSSSGSVLSPPRNLQASVIGDKIKLDWDYPISDGGSAVIKYNIYRDTTPLGRSQFIPFDKIKYSTVQTSFTDSDVIKGVTYYYILTSVNSVSSDYSSMVSAKIEEIAEPVAPQEEKNPNSFPEFFKYGEQNNANLNNALLKIVSEFNVVGVQMTPELLATIMTTLEKEVGTTFLSVEENGDYGMGLGCSYPLDIDNDGIKECRGTPYEGGVDYKGRGYIQITHKSNYQSHCGSECLGTSSPEKDVCGCKNNLKCSVQDENICPQVKALRPGYAARIFASYYIKTYYGNKNLVQLSKEENFWQVGKKINGGDIYASSFETKAKEYLALFKNYQSKTSNLIDSYSNDEVVELQTAGMVPPTPQQSQTSQEQQENVVSGAISSKEEKETCWQASEYLTRKISQIKKFCKCTQGEYDYQRYNRERGRGMEAQQYVDYNDNENFETEMKFVSSPVYEVQCDDGELYSVNKDYFSNVAVQIQQPTIEEQKVEEEVANTTPEPSRTSTDIRTSIRDTMDRMRSRIEMPSIRR